MSTRTRVGWGGTVASVALLATSAWAAEGPQPKIQVDQPVIDLGEIWGQDSIERVFDVKNVGEAPLQITRIKSTCGCTAVDSKARTVLPGATTQIKVRFNPKGIKGRFSKSIYVESDNPGRARYPLKLTGNVRSVITMVPAMARFVNIDRNEPATVEVSLINNMDEPMTPTDATCSASNVSVKLAEVEKGKKYKVTLTANPPYTGTALHGKVTVKTGLSKAPEHKINFFGRVPSPIVIEPSTSIDLGELDSAKSYTRTARIVSKDATTFEITEVSSSNWRFMPVVREVVPKREYEVAVTAHPPYEWGMNRALLTFRVRSRLSPRLTLQLRGERVEPIKASPTSLLFKDLTRGKAAQESCTIAVKAGAPVQMKAARSSLPNVKVGIEALDAGATYRLTVTANPPFKPGSLKGEITVETTHPEMKTLTIPFRSSGARPPTPAVTVVPDPVLVVPKLRSKGTAHISRFFARGNDGEKVHVTRVETSSDGISTSIEPHKGAEDTLTLIRVKIAPNAEIRPEGETITIYTDHQKFPRVTRRIAMAGTPGAKTSPTNRARSTVRRARPVPSRR